MCGFSKRQVASICIKYLIKIVKDPNFPYDVSLAIKNSFEAADKDFITNVAVNKDGEVIDRSGSCAIIALFVGISFHKFFRQYLLYCKCRRFKSYSFYRRGEDNYSAFK